MNVGVVGLGLMGSPIAARLAMRGHRVLVNSRRRESAEEAVAAGAEWAELPELVAGSDIVLTMLPRGEDVALNLLGDPELFASGARLVVDMSTVGPAWARQIGGALAERDVAFADAPVSGGPAGAAAGSLAIMVGANEQVFVQLEPLLAELGSPRRMGEIGAGQATKLVNQVLIGGVMSGIADATALAAQQGLDAAAVLGAVHGGFAGSALLEWAWPRVAAGDMRPGFKVAHFVKDLELALGTAAASGLTLALTSGVRDAYLSLGPTGAELGTQALARYTTTADSAASADTAR